MRTETKCDRRKLLVRLCLGVLYSVLPAAILYYFANPNEVLVLTVVLVLAVLVWGKWVWQDYHDLPQ